MPGNQRTSNPCIRARRARISWIVLFKTCPSVSMPVMFGGGITIENGGFDDCGFATKSRFSSQCWYHFGSTAFGSYRLGSSTIVQASETEQQLQHRPSACQLPSFSL